MGFERRFDLALIWRTLLLGGTLALFVWSWTVPGLSAARLLTGAFVLLAFLLLWSTIRRTNRDIARFVEALRFGDFSQRFASPSGGRFDELGEALDAAVDALRDRRAAATEESRFLSVALDDAPVALLSITDDDRVTPLNKAARRLFDRAPLVHLDDFAAYGPELDAAMRLPPGGRRVTRIALGGVPQEVILATAQIERLGTPCIIASLLPVQAEFGRIALAAEANLVRVLTHEIMNSLTPVTSLARSSAELVAAAAERDPDLRDARDAAVTLASRADGILRFVGSYRDFAFAPDIRRHSFAARAWADQVAAVARADGAAAGIALSVVVEPPGATILGDPDLLAQVALNLVRNAGLAGASKVELRVRGGRDERTLVEVADDGPGIPPERREDVFLPFYTTRREGSGVGLSFARQIALAHGGSIVATTADLGGASIRLLF